MENVSSAPAQVVARYSELLNTQPIELEASRWGYVARRRLYWLHGPAGGFNSKSVEYMPSDLHITKESGKICVGPKSHKPWHPALHLQFGFQLAIRPHEVAAGHAPPIHTF